MSVGKRFRRFRTDKNRFFFVRCAMCARRCPYRTISALADKYLYARQKERGVTDVNAFDYKCGVALWRGDITRLNADAIVNACNPALLGCFHPLHNCIDNVIHSAAGVQVRLDCNKIMRDVRRRTDG